MLADMWIDEITFEKWDHQYSIEGELRNSFGQPHQYSSPGTSTPDIDPIAISMPEIYAAPSNYAFPRNFKGYGEKGLEGLKWPGNAKIAVSFVINYEEVCS